MFYFIANCASRTGKSGESWQKILSELSSRGTKYIAYETEYEGHARELAARISRMDDPDICLVVVGGDGTLNEVLNGISGFEHIRVGMIPTGSANDFGKGIGLPSDELENLNMILENGAKGKDCFRRLDLGRVDGNSEETPRIFAISAGIGLDAIVCKKALHSNLKKFLNKIHLGSLTYILLTVQTLFSMKTENLKLVFYNKEGGKETAERVKYFKTIFLAAMNLRAEGGGVPMAPDADPCDGKLSVSSASGIPKLLTFFCLPLLVMAKQKYVSGFQIKDCSKVKVISTGPMVVHADGEYGGEVTEAVFECLPGKMKFLQ